MAVVEMSKINLIAMDLDRDKILNALQRTRAIEIKLHSETENTMPCETDTEALRDRLSKGEAALEVLISRVENHYKQQKIKSDNLGEVEIGYTEFIQARETVAENECLIEKINLLLDEEKELNGELAKVNRLLSSAKIYSGYTSPLHAGSSAHAVTKIGTVPTAQKDNFIKTADGIELLAYKFMASDGENELITLALHKAADAEVYDLLQGANFVSCPFDDTRTGEELYLSFKEQENGIVQKIADVNSQILALDTHVRGLKIYCDFVGFELEKASLAEKMRKTQTTFLLEAYVPKESQDEVKSAIDGATETAWYEFSEPAEDEVPPTLLKNNKVVKNFEAVTDMYSPVNYREFDPNTIMAFFYSVFLGFIMGDVIYGLIMFVMGGFLWLKTKRETGMKKLAGVFAIGGIFASLWGVLFNSFLGMNALPFTVMPDAQSGRYTVVNNIQIPSVLIISMLIGMVQLCAGYVCKAVQCWRKGDIWGGIFDGVSWAAFMVGLMLAVVGLVEEFKLPSLAIAGGIIAGASLLLAMLTAGRKEKFFGKFTKGFGAAYGVINVVSDILSYARLYGLMLSGAVIAQIISGFVVTGYNGSTPFLFSGNPMLIILGVVLMLVGHAFNLAIGLLGAYIHDARLQYVEFYGRFYEGEGSLFTPLGSNMKHTYL
ncbi:MAG: V-type ATP synthase subunit I, partial [Clostridia bacterium]|nr:V-type ATP synthase subunit I [Clostridia bacterium]